MILLVRRSNPMYDPRESSLTKSYKNCRACDYAFPNSGIIPTVFFCLPPECYLSTVFEFPIWNGIVQRKEKNLSSPNPLAYFNGPTDFGNQLGKAIAARINTDSYSSNSPSKLTFGSYPMSSYSSQGYGGTTDYGTQTYVVQPDVYQQQGMTQGGYGTQGYGNQQLGYTFNSFPNNNYNQYGGQTAVMPNNYNYGNYGNMATSYGNVNGFGNYATAGYGIPDPITTGGVPNSGASCPYCFGNKGGYKAKKAKRESTKKD
ncbi:hypothetical protein RB195_019792 [Necator americanus]|uniref:Uncharacterized protein n=2 Tax=Necator americanus TaxID=51031 RepID=A0ABR1CFU9_NECAM